MKKLLLASLVMIFLLSIDCLATTYYVDGSNGNDGNSGTAVSSAWKTIGKANSVLQAGDTVYIREGTYSETIRPARSGSIGNYITYRSYPGETATITGFPYAVDLSDKSYIKVDSLKMLNNKNWVILGDADGSGNCITSKTEHNIISNCIMREATGAGWDGISLVCGANYNLIINNTLIGNCPCTSICTGEGKGGPDDLIWLSKGANHNIIQGNILFDGVHNGIEFQTKGGNVNYNVVRDNFVRNKFHTGINIYSNSDHTLLEGNVVMDSGEICETDGCPLNYCGSDGDRTYKGLRDRQHGIQWGASDGIIRNNIMMNNGMGLDINSYDSDVLSQDNRVYHNTMVKNYHGIFSNCDGPEYGNVFKNNILYDQTILELRRTITGTPNDNYYVNNDIIGAPSRFDPEGTFASILELQGRLPAYFIGNLELEPSFTNSGGINDHDNSDFNQGWLFLQSGSSVIDKGAFLTKTESSGSGTSIHVEDASYFYDGWGIPGETGDIIRLERGGSARIESIDYSNNLLVVDSILDWEAGEGVSLDYAGAAPDPGAFELESGSDSCDGTDASCGAFPSCFNCNDNDGCSGISYRDYYCSGTSCSYNSDDCTDCSCSCGGYDIAESLSAGNCDDGKDNDCDGDIDEDDTGCQESDFPDDYIAYYRFDGNALDETGINHGTINNAGFTQDPERDQILSLDGEGYVDCGHDASLNSDAVTISAWVKNADTGIARAIAGKTDQYWLHKRNDNRFYFGFKNADGTYDRALGTVSHTEIKWYHVVGVKYDDGTSSIYVDGVHENTVMSQSGLAQSANDFTIGYLRDYWAGNTYWMGYMDDLMVYDRALSADEVLQIYQSQLPKECAGDADTDCDGCVDDLELVSHIDSWKEGVVAMLELLDAIDSWKGGCG